MTANSVNHRLIPPEAHHQLGKIERHNWLLKGILIKLADQLAATTVEDVKRILPAALHGKNSCVQRSGHSAFAAAFGRQPRVPGSLWDERNEPQGALLGARDP
eukprot:805917-Amphidinium_carterae.1